MVKQTTLKIFCVKALIIILYRIQKNTSTVSYTLQISSKTASYDYAIYELKMPLIVMQVRWLVCTWNIFEGGL